VKKIEEYTLEEINQIEDLELRNRLQRFYQERRLELGDTPFLKKIVKSYPNCSIASLESILEMKYFEHTSFYHFPNKQVYFYPTIKERQCEFGTTCAFSGGRIQRGSIYYCYRPLLDVVDLGRTFVLSKTLKLEASYFYYLPTTIQEFDIFTQKVENYCDYQNEPLDYEQLNYYFGGAVRLLELKKGRRKI